jgi:ankyrin repeat protein
MTHEKKNTLLLEYAEKGLTDGVLMALQAGADANHKDGSSDTALHLAATGIVRGLLGAGADVHAKDEAGRTALELAKDDATFEALKAGGTTMSDMTQ